MGFLFVFWFGFFLISEKKTHHTCTSHIDVIHTIFETMKAKALQSSHAITLFILDFLLDY